jgi:hypothetical protein
MHDATIKKSTTKVCEEIDYDERTEVLKRHLVISFMSLNLGIL